MKALTQWVFWILYNSWMAYAIWFGVHGNTGLWNLARTFIVFNLVVSVCLFIYLVVTFDSKNFVLSNKINHRAIPVWLSATIDVTLLLILYYFGHFVFGTMMMFEVAIGLFNAAAIQSRLKKITESPVDDGVKQNA